MQKITWWLNEVGYNNRKQGKAIHFKTAEKEKPSNIIKLKKYKNTIQKGKNISDNLKENKKINLITMAMKIGSNKNLFIFLW